MIQVKVCHYEGELNRVLEELQNEGHLIQDIKFSVTDKMLDWAAIIIYYDNSKAKDKILEILKSTPVTISTNSTDDSNIDYSKIEVRS